MAESNSSRESEPSNNGNGLVGQLLARIDQLSEAISARPTTVETETEVRRTFSSGNGGNNQNLQSLTGSSFSDSSQRVANRPRPYAARQYFSGQRPTNTRRATQKRRSTNAGDNKPFMRDLILLSGPGDCDVPHQGTRIALNERGHIITGCKFTKGQSMIEVERTIIEVLDGKIPPGVDIELLTSIHSKLVTPSFAPGQRGIDGVMLQRLYRNKPVYIRPNEQLLELDSFVVVEQVLRRFADN